MNRRPHALIRTRTSLAPIAIVGALAISGCSLGVMAGKMFTGEPLRPAQFRAMTGTDLTKGEQKIVVICSTPTSVDADLSSLNIDLIDGITRRMKVHGIDVIDPDEVAKWIDDNGGVVADPSEMARAFEADYVAWIDVYGFSLREENSPKLLRGRASGFLRVYQIQEVSGDRTALTAFNTEFKSTFPQHQPISETGRSALTFQKEFVDRICDELAEKFYDHRPGTGF
ncbi:MAG: hypothetical protein SFV23_08925 [Planctomycetaceae bacterium]|nr:hypothetical protein [Planctomycetaceae bacterium]